MTATIRARVCEACHVWPCRCQREPAVPVYVEPQFRVERCLCGNFIVAYDLTDKGITAAVHGHNRTVGHELWRGTWSSCTAGDHRPLMVRPAGTSSG